MASRNPEPGSRATMSDVARVAGVSIKTVSRVVNNEGLVSQATREAVLEAIASLGFRRNEAARGLRRGTDEIIGLVIDDVSDPFYSGIVRAVEDVAFEHGYTLLIGSYARDAARTRSIVDAFAARGASGLIVVSADGKPAALAQREVESGRVVVLADRPLDGVNADAVLVDNVGGVCTGTQHLISHGHRRIAFVGDSDDVFTSTERRAGYVQALESAGIPVDEDLIINSHQGVETAWIEALLDLPKPPTAFMTGTGPSTVGVIRVLSRRGLTGQVALVGFDDLELAELLVPAVTVVAQDPAAIGSLAAHHLLDRLSGERTGPAEEIRLTTRLIQRGSGEIQGPFSDRT